MRALTARMSRRFARVSRRALSDWLTNESRLLDLRSDPEVPMMQPNIASSGHTVSAISGRVQDRNYWIPDQFYISIAEPGFWAVEFFFDVVASFAADVCAS